MLFLFAAKSRISCKFLHGRPTKGFTPGYRLF